MLAEVTGITQRGCTWPPYYVKVGTVNALRDAFQSGLMRPLAPILRDDMPRSLIHCMNEVCSNLENVRNARSAETERRAGLLRAELKYGRIEDIEAGGLHPYLTRFLERINDLGGRISQDFLVPLSA